MSISFENDMGPEAADKIRELFSVTAMDKKTALLEQMSNINRKDMGDIARLAKQPMQMEINKIGDRKEVGGVVYELDDKGWKRLPIGTTL
jgi:hypothetical protein